MDRLLTHSVAGTYAIYGAVWSFLLYVAAERPGASAISLADLLNYRSSLRSNAQGRSIRANSGLRDWVRRGFPGLDGSAIAHLEAGGDPQLERGRAVRTRDPLKGAYSDLEYDGMHRALHASYAAGEVSGQNYALCLLVQSIALRDAQIALMKTRDLIVEERPDGSFLHVLRVPRVKQRSQNARDEFTDRPLVDGIGAVLQVQASRMRAEARAAGSDPEDAPLFGHYGPRATFKTDEPGPVQLTSDAIGKRILSTFRGLGVRSERTGAVINAGVARSRRTLGTRAAAEGHGALVIAHMLDHSDDRCARLYVEARPEMLGRIDRALAATLAPMAQRFAGLIASREENDPDGVARHVFGAVSEGGGPEDIGGCGKHSACGLVKPLACYTCKLFRPWLDGPHELVLEQQLTRRQRLIEAGPAALRR